MKTIKSLLKYFWSFIRPWEHYIGYDSGSEDKTVVTYWKKHKRKDIYVIYKMETL